MCAGCHAVGWDEKSTCMEGVKAGIVCNGGESLGVEEPADLLMRSSNA